MNITQLLAFSTKNQASDLHLSAGLPPMIRVHGDVKRINLPPMEHKEVHAMVYDIMDMLEAEDFYSPAHRLIFEAFCELYRLNRPVDLLTVTDWLQKQGQLEAVGGSLYLTSLSSAVVSAANFSYHAEIVREKSIRRRLISTSSEILSRCFDAEEEVNRMFRRRMDHYELADIL